MRHAAALQRLRQLADLIDQVAPADVGVIGERLGSDGDGLEHARTIPIHEAPRYYPSVGVLNGRIYRAAFLPLLFALVIAGFSLTGRTTPLSSSLAPDAFEGARAFATLQALARQFPERRPGSAGDQRLAAYLTQACAGGAVPQRVASR